MSGVKINVDMQNFRTRVNRVIAQTPQRVHRALDEIANDVSGEAKDLAPFREGHLTESIRGEVVQDRNTGKTAAVIYIPANHQAASYAIKMHENTYNLGPGSMAKQQRTGKPIGRKFITRALDSRRERIRKIIEHYFREKK